MSSHTLEFHDKKCADWRSLILNNFSALKPYAINLNIIYSDVTRLRKENSKFSKRVSQKENLLNPLWLIEFLF